MKILKRILFVIFAVFIFSACGFAGEKTVISNKPLAKVDSPKTAIQAVIKKIPASIIYATGRGSAPSDTSLTETQRYLLSERAAIIDGYRVLSEKLEGFLVEAFTKAGMYEVYADKITIFTQSFIKGAEIVEIKHKDNGICEAVIKIAFNGTI